MIQGEEQLDNQPGSVTKPVQPKILYADKEAPYATPLILNALPGSAPMIPYS